MVRRLGAVRWLPAVGGWIVMAVLGGSSGGVAFAAAQEADFRSFDQDDVINYSQEAIGNQVGDYEFIDRDGERVRLSEFFGAPLIISMVYTSCPSECPAHTQHLDDAVQKARDAVGDGSFQVVTIGFDSQVDTPERMRSFANRHRVRTDGWDFLSAEDQETIDALAADIGFVYFSSPRGFDHTVKSTVLDGDGRVYRHIYGEVVSTPQLVTPLRELVWGAPRSDQGFMEHLSNRIKLFCTVYDPKADRYYFDYSLFAGIFIGAVIISGTIAFLIREMFRRRRSGSGDI